MAWKVSGRNCLTEEFRKKQPNLLPDQEEQVLWGVRSPPVKSSLADVINGKTDPFQYPLPCVLQYLSYLF